MKREELVWRKSTRSGGQGDCVEVADLADGGKAMRDSKDPDGAMLMFNRREWVAFVGGVRDGEFGE